MPRSSFKRAFACAVLAAAFSTSCATSHPAKVAVAPTPELRPQSSAAPTPPQPTRTTVAEQRLHQVGTGLEQIIAQPTLGVPDAVLNRTACLAVFPAARGTALALQGFGSCRNSTGLWTSPVVLNLAYAPGARASSEDLYLFVLSDRARQQLVSGRLELFSPLKVSAGPTTQDAVVLDQVKASNDVFAYRRAGTSLRGTAVPAAGVTLDAFETQRLYGHPLDAGQLLSDSTMSSSVTSFYRVDVSSFFNTIVPVGIIIHHSVLVPGGGMREIEQTLDDFHSARGYEVSCFGKTYHIAYHYVILPSGKVVSGRPERCEGAHARGYNSYLGIALIGNFSSRPGSKGPVQPTKAQLASLVRLCCYLRQKYSIPLQRIMPHSAVSKTECPGDGLNFNTVLASISHRESRGGS